MVIIAVDKIEKFIRQHANARASLSSWQQFAEGASWTCPQDVKNSLPFTKILFGNRLIFKIGGNNFRLVVLAQYSNGILLIQDIGTHADYDKWNLD